MTNVGGYRSDPFAIRYLASLDNVLSAADVLLGKENRAALPAGQDSGGSFNVTIPALLPPGTYFIGAVIDSNDGNSANNRKLANQAVTVTANAEFQINAGLNDAWYDPATAGQGFFITVFPARQEMFLAWFTYDLSRPPANVTAQLGEPGHRWITAQGPYAGDTATLGITISEGGVFDASVPAPANRAGGTLTVTFSSCTAGEVAYEMPALGRSGTVPIQRIALDNVPECEESQGNP
ncbi:MAG: hypothetical protein MUF81_21160 [Verrucomicrobia bacterium]|nr:hypothetical protein [Verrucomicrobiota bacterium]